MAQKPSIPKGTRDFTPRETAERNYIFDTIKSVFKAFGYAQIETPAMENLSTLLGKYGDEGDKLLYRILNSGDAFSGIDFDAYKLEADQYNSKALSLQVCEKGLRYDLTVPFARFVVQHQNELSFPFKRFQIQPVWRADRPQKGRYREFYQCDVDAIGSRSQMCELELVQIIDSVFNKLGINVLVKINNRKVLTGLAEICGAPEKVVDITIAIDKLEKIGLDAVKAELADKGLSTEAIATLEPILTMTGDNEGKLATMRAIMSGDNATKSASETGLKGLDELAELLGLIRAAAVKTECEIDLSLARGLNYYTGAIFEVKALDFKIGSICGGGRYDNLTGIFGLPDMSGVGVSFGADRIYDVLKGLDIFPADLQSGSDLLIANLDPETLPMNLRLADALRAQDVSVEIYPEASKLKKQFDYADRKAIPFISINGSDELAKGLVNIKDLSGGQQRSFAQNDTAAMAAFIKGNPAD